MKKQSRSRIWVVVIAIALFLLISACSNSAAEKKPASAEPAKEVITITGEELGEYGRIVILNASSDAPAEKYLYKVPAGEYKVTTDAAKAAAVYIVKDEVQNTGSEKYPEELAYIGKGQNLTAGEELVKKGLASKEILITISEDESILLVGPYTIFLEKIQ